MLDFGRSVLNRGYILLDVLKVFVSTVNMCNLHAILFIEDHKEIFYSIYKMNVPSIQC
jgi:hypothetical protein